MTSIVVDGVKPYDGRYEFDLVGQELTTREWGWIKRLTGYLPMTMSDGFEGGDPELFACFAAIALRRAGRIENQDVAGLFERICDAPFGSTIRLELDEPAEDDDADPPQPSSSSNAASSGDESTNTLVISPNPPNGSGTPGSDISRWPLTRSET